MGSGDERDEGDAGMRETRGRGDAGTRRIINSPVPSPQSPVPSPQSLTW
ncbi:MAG: hypothetical protein KME21_20805 [Desmonostoc vinosum HA7617-LM4]|nr:hypothetical protein [Desmonostoc vinosum HA7617-LM4]